MSGTNPLPTLFLSHGAPDLLLGDLPARRFLVSLAARLPRPRAIVVVSAHWETGEPAVETGAAPRTIHDFAGFPRELSQRRYPAPGDPALAGEILALLAAAGLPAAGAERGFDHGVWVPLAMLFPAASVPVVALSVQPQRDPAWHWRLGEALRLLPGRGVLVIGSGAATHDLASITPDHDAPAPFWVQEFDAWLVARCIAGDREALIGYRQHGPHAADNHPTPEHFLPLLVAMAAAGEGARAELLHRSTTWGVLQMTMLGFSAPPSPAVRSRPS
jgi:4,5-DOPA dioxygenase extradiol